MSSIKSFEEPTEESWRLLRELASEYQGIVLLGGWAAWVHNRSAKSHDVDVIVPIEQFDRMRQVEDLGHSTHIGGEKWKLARGPDTHADIYVPFRSRLGRRLDLPVENLLPYAGEIAGLLVLDREALVAAKFAGLLDRPDSLPGRKDRDDLVGLFLQTDGFDWGKVGAILSPPTAPSPARLSLALEALRRVVEAQGLSREDRQMLRERLTAGREAVESLLAAPATQGVTQAEPPATEAWIRRPQIVRRPRGPR